MKERNLKHADPFQWGNINMKKCWNDQPQPPLFYLVFMVIEKRDSRWRFKCGTLIGWGWLDNLISIRDNNDSNPLPAHNLCP